MIYYYNILFENGLILSLKNITKTNITIKQQLLNYSNSMCDWKTGDEPYKCDDVVKVWKTINSMSNDLHGDNIN